MELIFWVMTMPPPGGWITATGKYTDSRGIRSRITLNHHRAVELEALA